MAPMPASNDARGVLSTDAPTSATPFAFEKEGEGNRVVPLPEFGAIRLNLEEILREIIWLSSSIRSLITEEKKTTRVREVLQLLGGRMRSTADGKATERGICAGGSYSARTATMQHRLSEAVANSHAKRLQINELRCAIDELQKEHDRLHELSGDGLVRHRGYDDGPGEYPMNYCNEGPLSL